MRWQRGRRSTNIEDRRGGRRVGRAAGIGGGTAVIAVIAAMVLGVDPGQIMGLLGGGGGGGFSTGPRASYESAPAQLDPQEEQVKDFLAVVLGDTEQVWNEMFQKAGARYAAPKLVLYRASTPTACGQGDAAAGPFYCPGDQKLYLDLSFLGEMKKMGAEGDFALAYVIAHEVGHHIQTLQGIAGKVQSMKARAGSKVEANQLQVRMELQADCYAGVWAHHAHKDRQMLEPGDIEEGIKAAASVGDDHLQRQAGRRVVPEAFTHGSSEQRMEWLQRGLVSGDLQKCQTFG